MTAVLPTRALGSTGMEITQVGFGAWAVGGGGWASAGVPRTTRDRSPRSATLSSAASTGSTPPRSTASATPRRSSPRRSTDSRRPTGRIVFTKGGPVWDRERPDASRRATSASRRACGARSRRACAGSRVERIDLYQMHWPAEDGTPLEAYWRRFLDLKRRARSARSGLSNHGVDAARRRRGARPRRLAPAAVLAHQARGPAADVMPWCAAHGTGVIVYSPMQSGLLSGRVRARRVPRRSPRMTGVARARTSPAPKLARNLALAEALRPIAERARPSVGAVAVAWTLAYAGGHRRDRRRAQPVPGRRLVGGRQPRP